MRPLLISHTISTVLSILVAATVLQSASPLAIAALAPITVTPTNFSAVEGQARTDVIVATALDGTGGAGTLSATIDWGDGTQITNGSLVANGFNRFVVQSYQDLLGRSPASAELTTATSLGNQSELANSILSSAEYRTLVVRGIYQRLLHRDPDPAGLTLGLNFLNAGSSTEQFTAVIAGSTEYYVSRGGGTNSGFLSALYMDLLGRPIDSAGLGAYGQLLTAGTSRGDVAFSIINSNESRALLVRGYYQRFLGRAPSAGELQTFLSFLSQGGTGNQVVAIILASAEYYQHTGATQGTYDVLGTHTYSEQGIYSVTVVVMNGTDIGVGVATATVGDAPVTPFGRTITRSTLFLQRLYQDVLGRPVDPQSLGSMSTYLQIDGRISAARALFQTEEFAVKVVSDLYNRYLGRSPSKSELDELVPAVRLGGEQLAARIFASDEYFSLHQSTAESFVAGLYQDILGRTPTSEEISGLIGLLRPQKLVAQESARKRAALKLLRLPESRAFLVNSLYMKYLGRTPTEGSPRAPGELDRALMLLKRKTTWEALAMLLVGSQEYLGRATEGFGAGTEFTVNVGSFIDANPDSTGEDFTGTIDWGDGSIQTAATIIKDHGVFFGGGSHVYAVSGVYPVTLRLNDDTVILSQIVITGECPADVTDSVTVIKANAKFDAVSRHASQKLSITNRGTTPIVGPIYVVIDGLPFSASLANANGMTTCVEPIGRPYVKLAAASDLAPGARTTVTLEILNPLKAKARYRVLVIAGGGTP